MGVEEITDISPLPLLSLNHVSFLCRSCSNVGPVKKKLEEMGMEYAAAIVEEGGIKVDQLFFHDPDGYMIEICNCHNIPVLPVSTCTTLKPTKGYSKGVGGGFILENLMMEHLKANMMNFSF